MRKTVPPIFFRQINPHTDELVVMEKFDLDKYFIYDYAVKIGVVIEYDPKVKGYGAYCPELPGCTSAGDTEREALENFKEAFALYFEPTPLKLKNHSAVKKVSV